MGKILDAIKTAIVDGVAEVNMREASTLTGSGSGVGGNTVFDTAFHSARLGNPLRQMSRIVPVTGSILQFVAKIGNAAYQTNPWGYALQNNTGSPNIDTSIWQLPVQSINAALPIRSAVMSDINGLDEAIVSDLADEFATQEGASMIINDDQSGSTTTATGATSGLRGLNSYLVSTGAAAFGDSGTADNDGIHTLLSVTPTGNALVYNEIINLASALPAQYWHLPGTAWMMHPLTLQTLRKLRDDTNLPMFLDVGEAHDEAYQYLLGWKVVTNPNMDYIDGESAIGTRYIYLANWPRFHTIGDNGAMTIKRMDQTSPGQIVLYSETRVVASVRDPFAGVVLGT